MIIYNSNCACKACFLPSTSMKMEFWYSSYIIWKPFPPGGQTAPFSLWLSPEANHASLEFCSLARSKLSCVFFDKVFLLAWGYVDALPVAIHGQYC
ncbi:hypothetical protein Nepgr_025450 [Nepenthes gracilis]|uniref:Uncharacterized protein n=1 Tax=Nepenthes gracilis TaxID=150966 RepID=A0AAD3XZI6_NEPGR|nr:hypothetical protein Nepgr_025450 [Nepenthes gracilis]